ncbi:MAG: ATP-binding cassette domain-containing protein [Desulfobacterales bacterium]
MELVGNDIAYRYPHAAADLFAGLDFRIRGPGFHALFGPSGVGKSTLARLISGMLPAHRGSIAAQGMQRVLYTYNLERLPGWVTLRRHFEETASAAGKPRLETLLDIFDIRPLVEARFPRLSLGQQNRANLVRYLLQEFDLLIMDESLANVDEATRQRIILQMKALFPERCFLYISHNVAEVARFCGEVLVLRGRPKQPQIVSVSGGDQREGAEPDPARLERAMLAILHAA